MSSSSQPPVILAALPVFTWWWHRDNHEKDPCSSNTLWAHKTPGILSQLYVQKHQLNAHHSSPQIISAWVSGCGLLQDAAPDDLTADSCVAAHRTLHRTPEVEVVLNLILQREKRHREVISQRTNRKDYRTMEVLPRSPFHNPVAWKYFSFPLLGWTSFQNFKMGTKLEVIYNWLQRKEKKKSVKTLHFYLIGLLPGKMNI